MAKKILRLGAIVEQCSLSRSTIYNRIKSNDFPKPVSLGGRSVGWLESEIEDWLTNKIEDSRKEEE